MFPTLLQIGPVYISSLGFFSFLGFLFGGFVLWRKGKEENFDEEPILDLWILSLLSGFLTGRLLFCLTNPLYFSKPFLGFFSFVKLPGISFLGLILGMFITWIIFSDKAKWDFWKLADVAVFSVICFQIFWRLGQFLDGSFFGKQTLLPWKISFPGIEGARHPIQLYDFLFLIFLWVLLTKLVRRYRFFSWYQNKRGEAEPGFLFLVYVLFYGLWRLLLEFLHESSLYFEGIAWQQLVGMVMVLVGLFGFWARLGREIKIDLAFLRKKEKKLQPLMPKEKKVERKQGKIKKFKHIKTGIDVR